MCETVVPGVVAVSELHGMLGIKLTYRKARVQTRRLLAHLQRRDGSTKCTFDM